jgi:ATP adenylyltransferase
VPEATADEDNLVLYRGRHAYVVLNRFPYSTGHLMVVPYQHLANLSDLPADCLLELMQLAQRAERALGVVYRPGGLNMGLNLGECAGAGIAAHLHLHILPRWPGDASFMTTIGETRVIPEELHDTWAKLKPQFAV